MGTGTLDLRLSAGPGAARQARDELSGLEHRMDPETLEDLRLLVSELVTNSFRHAALPRDASIDLRVKVGENTVRAEVYDRGTGFAPPMGPPAPGAASGWGLYLVDQISDRWGVTGSDSTCVWFELDRPRTPGARR